MRRDLVRGCGRIVQITLLENEAAAVSFVLPQVVLQVSLLGAARTDHAGEQRSEFSGLAWPGDKDRQDVHWRRHDRSFSCARYGRTGEPCAPRVVFSHAAVLARAASASMSFAAI